MSISVKNPDANVVMLGTALPAPADMGLNLDDKGYIPFHNIPAVCHSVLHSWHCHYT